MKKPLLVALAAVLSSALYLNAQDEADIELAKGAAKRAQRPGPIESVGGVAKAPSFSPATASAAPGGGADALQMRTMRSAMMRWLERAEEISPGGSGESAWVASMPVPMRVEAEPSETESPQVEPAPPAFPHAWVGRIEDDGPPGTAESPVAGASAVRRPPLRAVISSADRTWLVREGEMLDENWRLDAIHSRSLQLTYLPLNKTLTVLKP